MNSSPELEKFLERIETAFENSVSFVPFFKKNMRNKYRGNHSFAQERLSLQQISILIEEFKKIANENLIFIPPTPKDKDIQPDHEFFEEASDFRKLIYELNMREDYITTAGNKTNLNQITLKKITLLNCWKIGVVDKYICDKNNQCNIVPVNSDKRGYKTYYSLTKKAIELSKMNYVDKITELSRMLKNTLVNSDVEILFELLLDERTEMYGVKSISNAIYATTLNYWGLEYNSKTEVLEAFYELWLNRKSWESFLVDGLTLLQEQTEEKEYTKKYGKIDWGNWKNQVQTKYSFLNQTPQFTLNEKNELLFCIEGLEKIKFGRSKKEKEKYFSENEIDKNMRKKLKYELHHIVSISSADNAEELKLIDSWKNMIYISPDCHSMFPKRNNNIVLVSEIENEKIIVSDLIGDKKVEIVNNENSVFKKEHTKTFYNYNKKLLRIE